MAKYYSYLKFCYKYKRIHWLIKYNFLYLVANAALHYSVKTIVTISIWNIYIYITMVTMVHLFLTDSHMIENREMLEWSSWTHLVGLALSRAGAHGIHPQVRVHLVRTHSRMRINHFGQSHWHRSRAQVQTRDAKVSEQKPNPSGKQHPPHIHTIKKSFRKRKRSRGRKATQSPPK